MSFVGGVGCQHGLPVGIGGVVMSVRQLIHGNVIDAEFEVVDE